MQNLSLTLLVFLLSMVATLSVTAQLGTDNEAYLTMTASQAEAIAKSTRERGKAGGSFDVRIISTNKAINYGLRATLMTPDVIRATARYIQLRDRLTNDQTRKLVRDAEAAGDLIVMIEINPNEGSGVIPLDWRVLLQPKDLTPGSEGAIPGVKAPHLRKDPVLSGLFGRNYEYDVFWVAFPLVGADRKALLSPDLKELQLIVGIYRSEARISWKMPVSVREKIIALSKNSSGEKQ